MKPLDKIIKVLIMAASLAGGTSSSAEVAVKDIAEAWQARERNLGSGRIRWEERTFHPRGSVSGHMADAAIPAEDTTVEANKEYAWDGDRMSYRQQGMTPAIDGNGFVPLESAEVRGGSGGSRMFRQNESVEHPMGTIWNSEALSTRESVELIPILLWARPLNSLGCGIDVARCRILPGMKPVEGRDCVVLRQSRGKGIDEWFIDVERDFSIVRYEFRDREEPRVRIDLSYAQDEEARWRPIGWRSLMLTAGGAIQADFEATVTEYAIGFKPNPDMFELDFPSGTWVNDQVRGVEYLVRPDGSQRLITQGELRMGATYSELLHSETGLAKTTPPPAWREWILWAASIALVVSLATVVVNRFRSARRAE